MGQSRVIEAPMSNGESLSTDGTRQSTYSIFTDAHWQDTRGCLARASTQHRFSPTQLRSLTQLCVSLTHLRVSLTALSRKGKRAGDWSRFLLRCDAERRPPFPQQLLRQEAGRHSRDDSRTGGFGAHTADAMA
eukprot:CAMPEP_0174386678 /NCGR_PEP_ID=MMETSP0811_2-20130205/127432_1 /TAXON_ID=73025 ORGANISM="Eutreptiella gymnastica-like, Strain CCMP1594" /NCGR_SAMPLE_ID=MMETSP0811_2 /ASSEMBLY_ACC=CAM_ASM_000667 /LENGTH=132 /DNA_ID=CAMNT_0015541425 /DNA_START=789 /DNA_END=1188 /DNA_ORIENTATION=+